MAAMHRRSLRESHPATRPSVREAEFVVRCGRLRPVGGRFALSFEEAPFGWVGGQLDGAVVGGDGCVTLPSTDEEVGARGVVRL